MSQTTNHYRLLQVDPQASPEVIRSAWRAQAKNLHPDRQTGDSERMAAINEAYRVLGNASLRADYDSTLRRQQADEDAPSDWHRSEDIDEVWGEEEVLVDEWGEETAIPPDSPPQSSPPPRPTPQHVDPYPWEAGYVPPPVDPRWAQPPAPTAAPTIWLRGVHSAAATVARISLGIIVTMALTVAATSVLFSPTEAASNLVLWGVLAAIAILAGRSRANGGRTSAGYWIYLALAVGCALILGQQSSVLSGAIWLWLAIYVCCVESRRKAVTGTQRVL